MKDITLPAGEYSIVNSSTSSRLIATELGETIALTLYSSALKKAAMGVALSEKTITQMLNSFIKVDTSLSEGCIEVRLAGGNVGKEQKTAAEMNVKSVLQSLNTWDNDRNIINVISQNILQEGKGDAFCFTPVTNSLRLYDMRAVMLLR